MSSMRIREMLTNTVIKNNIYLFIDHGIVWIWTILYGPYYMDHVIWTILYGPYYMDHIIWTILCGPYHMDHVRWTNSYGMQYHGQDKCWNCYIKSMLVTMLVTNMISQTSLNCWMSVVIHTSQMQNQCPYFSEDNVTEDDCDAEYQDDRMTNIKKMKLILSIAYAWRWSQIQM